MDRDTMTNELQFKAVRSSGAGGQHVNKVASKVELTFDVEASMGLSAEEKKRLLQTIENRLTKDHLLLLQCDESRSQHKNKELAIQRFFEIIEAGLVVPKKRVPTKIPKAVIKKRLQSKRRTSEKKAHRKPPDTE